MNDYNHRRDAILTNLQREADSAASRRRLLKRTAAGTIAASLLVITAIQLTPHAPTPTPPNQVANIDPRITTHRADLAAYTITDDELIAALKATGEPFTLIWIDGKPKLIEPPAPGSI